MRVGITRMHFPWRRRDDVVNNIKNEIIPLHEDMKQQGQIERAIFVISEDERGRGEAIGIAVYSDDAVIEEVEGERGRDKLNRMRDPQEAPTDYTKKRAEAIKNVGGNMEKSDWYDFVGEV